MPILRTGICSRSSGFKPFKSLKPLIKAGFTLMELIVVIFLISLFLVISIPSIIVQSNEVRSEAKRIASILRYLNDTAMARKEELYLSVDFKDNSITYSTEKGEKRERIEYLRSIFLETKGEIDSGEVKVIFTPLGAGELLRFNLTDNHKKENTPAFSIELNPLSGRVKINVQDSGFKEI